jgi:glycosyltransferase involved in cell wall biosynthesis
MRILVVQDTDWIRRNPYQHTHLAERLVLRGHDIRVIDYEILWRAEGKKELISRRRTYNVSRIFKDAKIRVIRPSILKIPLLDYVSMFFTYSKEINFQIRSFKPDVILGNDILTTYLAYRAAKKNNIPAIHYTIDVDYRLIPFKFLQPIGKIFESKNIRSADLVIAINEGLREYTIRMGANPAKTLVIRASVDSQRYDPRIDGGKIRGEYGIRKDDTVLFFTGWLYHFSGLKEVALELSKIQDKNIKLLIVGDGDAYEDLQKIREKHNMQDRVILTGKRPFEEMPAFVAASDICLLPAYPAERIMHDIVPIKMYEYMAMKKPVIATGFPGIRKEFGKGNGVVYIDRPEDAVEKAVELVASGSVNELGSRARRFIEKYSWDNATDEFERTLQKVLRAKQKGNA